MPVHCRSPLDSNYGVLHFTFFLGVCQRLMQGCPYITPSLLFQIQIIPPNATVATVQFRRLHWEERTSIYRRLHRIY